MAKILPVFLPFASCGNKCIFCDQQAISGVKAENNLIILAENQIKTWLSYGTSYDEIAFYGGLLNMIFFGGASALFFAMASHKRIRRIPFLIIYADRLGIYKQRNGDYHTINYADVKKFRLVKIHSSKMIAVDYKTAPLIHKFDGASDLKQNIMNFNFNEIGAIENIPVHNLTMKGKDICDILNRRLNCWQVRPAE